MQFKVKIDPGLAYEVLLIPEKSMIQMEFVNNQITLAIAVPPSSSST